MMSALNDLVDYGEVPYFDLLNARAELATLRAELAAAQRTIDEQADQIESLQHDVWLARM